ncbi:hypothetical protein [Neptuniibacter halophilus]|uniref:arsenate reductase/protein-tyrosine-phosphatase family protein n=1 Tax=Neptuniibacter halophilus TaxID=651666 RepID=UPI0025743F81|nr:hypothetical protein [Neptuniibacter halophilus]
MNILFVCRHNAIRSQIAMILANHLGKGNVTAVSAGIEPTPVPEFIQQWAAGINKQAQPLQSTQLETLADQHFDMIITLCDKSHQAIPELASDREHIRWDFSHPDDPEQLRHLEIELAERLRLMFLAKGLIH